MRIKAAFGRTQGYLPGITEESLRLYYEHLAARLSFPFAARYFEPMGIHSERVRHVTVVGVYNPIDRPTPAVSTGIVCRVRTGTEETDLPLADLEVDFESPNYELIEDYWYWFWNWR
jgi:hypothetical protein